MLPRQTRAAGKPVVVVGAGLSGLYAALTLESQGYEVTVLEGRQRIGGRLYTLDDVPGHPEAGGNTIGPNYGRVISTARALGVDLAVPGRPEAMGLVLGDERVERESWGDSPHNSLPEPLRSVTPDRLGFGLLRDNPLAASSSWRSETTAGLDQSATDFYRARGLDDRALAWIDANNSYGNRLDQTSLLALYRVAGSIGRAIAMRQPAFEARDGNQRIPEAMAKVLKRRVETGVTVQRIQAGDDWTIESADGRQWQAAAVICALPATAVARIKFEPGLPSTQAEAVQQLNYHKVTQAHFVTTTPYWKDAGEPGGWWTDGPLGRVFTRQSPQGHWNITCWINGDACDRYDGLSHDDAMQRLRDDFLHLVPASRGHADLKAIQRWAKEPLNRGTWAIWKPGEIHRWANVLQAPHGRVAFAGEHTSWSNSGMEGAMESGERAALEVMRWLS